MPQQQLCRRLLAIYVCASCQFRGQNVILDIEEFLFTCNDFSTGKYPSCEQGQSYVWSDEGPYLSTFKEGVWPDEERLDSTRGASFERTVNSSDGKD